MQIINVEQGSPEWHEFRLGVVSASRFSDIQTEPRTKKDKDAGKLSMTSLAYMNELIAEIITRQYEELSAKPLDWGKTYEPEALEAYSFIKNIQVGSTGIILNDEGTIGGSPDGLVSGLADNGMIEVKCPFNPKNHIKTVIYGMPKEHMPQVQGNMMINGADYCDFISFDPRIKSKHRLYIQRIERDEAYIKSLKEKLTPFLSMMQDILLTKFQIKWNGVDVQGIQNKYNLLKAA